MTRATQKPAAEGEARKAEAFALLVARRERLIRQARRALLAVLLDRGAATIDVVRDRVPVPESVNPKVFGAVPGPLARAGLIVPDGFAKSRRPDAHARPLQVWHLANRAAAVDWLRMHPDRPDPLPTSETDTQRTLFDSDRNDTPGAGTPGGY